MKRVKLILILIFLTQTITAQKRVPKVINEYAAVDQLALQIPDSLTTTTQGIATYVNANFHNDVQKARAIFIWITTNIEYDIDNMFAINFYEKTERKIGKSLRSRKGICENYAAIFTAICTKVGLKSFVIEGYTKQNGFTDYIPHAWCAALIDSSWYMFDPTWGSGYVDNQRFYKKINNDYFKAQPFALIKSHMPFDFLWQFLNYPITNQEFYEGKTKPDKSKPFFNYVDSIQVYEKQTYLEQLTSSANRVEKNGVKNSMIFDRLEHIKIEIENIRQSEIMNLYNSAVSSSNDGINNFNEFIQYRNKKFTPTKTDPEIQGMIDSATNKFKDAKTKLDSIKNPDGNVITMMLQLNKSIDEATTHLQEQQDWLSKYFRKGKAARKLMFYDKVTRVPAN